MAEPVLSLEGIRFSRGEREILRGISWRVMQGEAAAILGANGCGKSTLLRIASGYLWPQRGTVRLLGETFGETALAPLRARVGIVEATTVYPFDETMTARDVVLSGYFSALTIAYVRPTDEQRAHAEAVLGQVGLGGREGQLFASMSTGERLRCLLARALVRKPAMLLLDEPTAGLDLPGREAVLATLAKLHRKGGAAGAAASESRPAMVIITHHLEELLPETDNILLLSREGAVQAAGGAAEVLTEKNLSAAYGVPVQISRRNGRYFAHVDPAAWEEMA